MNMNTLAILRLIFKHFDDAQELFALMPEVQRLVAGPRWVADRRDPAVKIIDVTFAVADELEDSLRTVSAMPVETQFAEEGRLYTSALKAGISPAQVMQLVQLVSGLIELFRSLRGGSVSAGNVELS